MARVVIVDADTASGSRRRLSNFKLVMQGAGNSFYAEDHAEQVPDRGLPE